MKRILVIGGAGGLGSAVIGKLTERGDTVYATVIDDQEETVLRSFAPSIGCIQQVDLSDAEQLRIRLDSLLTSIGLVDAVLVCAAISPYGPLETTSISVIRGTFEINCISNIVIFQSVLPVLRKTKGRLILTSSMAGIVAMPFVGSYVSSKFALEGAADVMRRESNPQGVKVILVEPGGIRTKMVSQQLSTLGPDTEKLEPEMAERYGYLYRGFAALAHKSYFETASTAEEVADVFLTALDDVSPNARYIAGADAQQLIAHARQSSDRDLDQTFLDAFSKTGP